MKKHSLLISKITIKLFVIFAIIIAAVYGWQLKQNLSAKEKMQRVQALAIAEKHEPMHDIKAEVVSVVNDTIETIEAETTTSFDEPVAMAVEEVPKYQPTHNLPELQAQNKDCVGWIAIDGTPVDYPVMLSDAEVDGENLYLHHAFDGSTSNHGSIFVDPDVDVENLHIVYGHNMKDKSMFGCLKNYREDDFWNEEHTISIYGMTGEAHLLPSCVIGGPEDGSVRNIRTAADLQEFAQNKSVIQGELPEAWNELIVLISCYGSGARTYVVCALD